VCLSRLKTSQSKLKTFSYRWHIIGRTTTPALKLTHKAVTGRRSWGGLPAKDAAKKATAPQGVTAIATSTAATAAIARHDIGVEAVVTVAAVTVAACVTVIVARTIATAVHFDGGARGLDRFGSACGNGKGIS
jgi:hypothetical protein